MNTEILTCTNVHCVQIIRVDYALEDEDHLICPHCHSDLGMLCDVRAAEMRAQHAKIGDAVAGGINVVKGVFSGLAGRFKKN